MTVLVTDRELGERLIAERRASGGDRFDEVWEGLYVMAPLADDEHQDLQGKLAAVFLSAVGWAGNGLVRPGVNVSDREDDWKSNYRCPDVVVYLPGNPARNRGTHWVGGLDLAVEIASPYDRSRDKLSFYAGVGVRELLVIDRRPWALEMYHRDERTLVSAGRVTPGDAASIESSVLPLTFSWRDGQPRPAIEVTDLKSGQRWLL